MPHWVHLCSLAEAPAEGQVIEAEADGVSICLARHHGELSALNNWCPHRQGPLGQGWIENDAVLCPWHSWAFNLQTGIADPPERAAVEVYPVRIEGESVVVQLGAAATPESPQVP